MKEIEKVAIIGGAGNMGRLTADLFRKIGFEPIVSDPRLVGSLTAREAIQLSRIVFFSVFPLEEVDKIVVENSNDFVADHIVLDNASLKKPLLHAFKILDEKGVSICSTHPLCKHDQLLHGQKVLVMDAGSNPTRAREIAEHLHQNAGMITIPFSLENHDKTMTVLQLLPHLVMRSVGEVLAQSGADMKSLVDIAPANFQLFNLSLWRTLVQDPKISAIIITNLIKEDEGLALAQGIKDAIERMMAEKDRDTLAESLRDSTMRLDKDGLGGVMNKTTSTVLEQLTSLRIGKLVGEQR